MSKYYVTFIYVHCEYVNVPFLCRSLRVLHKLLLCPSRRGGAFLDLYMFRVLLLLHLVQISVETVFAHLNIATLHHYWWLIIVTHHYWWLSHHKYCIIQSQMTHLWPTLELCHSWWFIVIDWGSTTTKIHQMTPWHNWEGPQLLLQQKSRMPLAGLVYLIEDFHY